VSVEPAANRRRASSSRLHGDEGAVIIEAALVAPVLLILLLGVFEYGVVFRDLLGASDAADTGAKYGAIQGPDLARLTAADGSEIGMVAPDYTIMLNTRAGLAGVSPSAIDRIVVFKAGPSSRGTPAEQVPEACKTSTVSIAGVCNVYLQPRAFREIEAGNLAYFDGDALAAAGQCPGFASCGWRPSAREDGPDPRIIDYLGVYIRLEREVITGIIPVPRTLEVAAVHRLEPGPIE
jgi:hypothetical protein